jgi:hypothetical protein
MTVRGMALCASATWCALVLAAACSPETDDQAAGETPDATAQTAEQTAAPAASDAPDAFSPPRTAWGEPDFRGTWPIDHLNGTPFQRPEQFGDRQFLTDEEFAERQSRLEAAASRYENEDSTNTMGMGHWAESGTANRRTSLLIDPPNGRLPAFTEEGQRRADLMRSSWRTGQSFNWVSDFDTWDLCITRGLPASMFPFQYNNGMQVFQSPGIVAIKMEMVHETRIIPTDGRAALPGQIEHWLGESRGRWEGDTLVVETTNLKAGPSVTNIGTTGSPPWNNTPISEEARIVERFTMTGPDSIVYEVTYNDPVVFTAPWTAHLDWQRDEDYGLFEYACHEANYMVRDYINAWRAGDIPPDRSDG